MYPYSIYLAGPTCSGKSAIAIKLAGYIHAEIVSCDSMQVYLGMDIGTAKPSREEQKKVPHHMIDIVPLNKEYNVALYVRDAEKVIREIQGREKVPLVVGGTGLYMKALIDGLFEYPSSGERIRKRLEEKVKIDGLASLYNELMKVDGISAERIKPQDKRRILRALEVYYTTGKPISFFQTQWGPAPSCSPLQRGRIYNVIIGLNRDREDLYKRIDKRVDEMFEKGLVDEVKGLLKHGLAENKTARQALGYKEILEYLDGKYSLEETKDLVKKNTRHFAKRQLTWFRKDDRVKWILIDKDEEVDSIADRAINILEAWREKEAQ